MKEEYSKNPSPKLLKEIQESQKHIPQLHGQLFKATGAAQVQQLRLPPVWVTYEVEFFSDVHFSSTVVPFTVRAFSYDVSLWFC